MDKQRGFTLIELMVVIGIIVILSVVGIPAYQNYLRRTALADLLQTFVPYRIAVKLRALDRGGLTVRDDGSSSIPSPTTTRHLFAMSAARGAVTLTGQESLNRLGVILTPTWDSAEGVTGWQRVCTITGNSALQQVCEDVFRVK